MSLQSRLATFINDVGADIKSLGLRLTAVEASWNGRPINAQTGTSYTLQTTDVDKWITFGNAAATTFTVPLNLSIPNDSEIPFSQVGAGQVSVVGISGVTIRCSSGANKLFNQFSTGGLKKLDTNEYLLYGKLTT